MWCYNNGSNYRSTVWESDVVFFLSHMLFVLSLTTLSISVSLALSWEIVIMGFWLVHWAFGWFIVLSWVLWTRQTWHLNTSFKQILQKFPSRTILFLKIFYGKWKIFFLQCIVHFSVNSVLFIYFFIYSIIYTVLYLYIHFYIF